MKAIIDNDLGGGVAKVIAHRPYISLALAFVIIIGCFSGARFLSPDFTYRAFFAPDDALRQQVERFEVTFGNDDSVVLLVHSPSGIVDKESADLIVNLTEQMWLVPDVVRVDSLSNFRWGRGRDDEIVVEPMIPDEGLSSESLRAERSAAIADEPLIPEYLLSADGKTTMVVGFVRNGGDNSPEAGPIISAVRDMIAKADVGDHQFYITGRMAIMAGMQESAQGDVQGILPFVLLTIIVLVALATRSAATVVATLILIVTSIVSTMGLSGWLGMTISNITAMVPQFIVAIAVASAVHVLMAFRRHRNEGLEKRIAVQRALTEKFVPTALTAITTSIAFMSFVATDITAIGNLGIMVGLGVLIAWVFTYLVLGSLLALLPEFRLRRSTTTAPFLSDRTHSRVAAYVAKLSVVRIPVVVGSVLLCTGAVVLASSNAINSNPFRYFDPSFWLRQSADFGEANLRGSQGIELVLNTGENDGVKSPEFMARAEQLQTWINEQPFVAKTVSIIDFVKQTNEALHGDNPDYYVMPDNRQELSELLFLYGFNLPEGLDLSNRVSLKNDSMRISIRWTLYDSALATEWAERIEQKASSLGLDAETTGKMLLFQRMNGYVSNALVISLTIAVTLISLILLLVFRSTRLGVASLLTNTMPLAIGAAVLTLVGRDFDTGAIVALSVCLGVAVDDTIHLLQAIKTSRATTAPEAVIDGLSKVLPAITLTTLILVIGFGAFMLGDFVPNQNFGLMAVTIISAAWVFDVVFLPALLLLLNPEVAPMPVRAGS